MFCCCKKEKKNLTHVCLRFCFGEYGTCVLSSDAYVVVWEIMQTLVKLGFEIEVLSDEIDSCLV